MITRHGRLKRAVVAVAAVAAAGCGVKAAGDAKYAADDCRRVALIDQATGAAIGGAEDLALDPVRDRLFVSAYDRRAAERAAGRRAFSVPEGGVYAVAFSEIVDAPASQNAAPLVRSGDVAGGLRPHGMTLDSAAGEIVFINRAYQRVNDRWRMAPRLVRIGLNGEVVADDVAPCAANDLIDTGKGTLVSFDHANCSWRAGLEDLTNAKRSGIAAAGGGVLFDEAAFANGIALTRDGEVLLAATRENALLVMSEDSKGFTERTRIELPGGPDNLTIAADGGIVAAVHPSALKIALNRRLGLGAAPSRIVKTDAAGSVETLFDDPTGKTFSAASVGIEHGDVLIAGSATDEGLLVCKAAG